MSGEKQAHTHGGGSTALPDGRERDTGNETRGTGHSSAPPAATPHPKHPALTLYPSVFPDNTYPSPEGLAKQAGALLRTARRMRPKKKCGAPRKERITLAVELYLEGKRGAQLYDAVIPDFRSLNRYRRNHEKEKMDDAIRKRLKRVGIPPTTNSAR